MEKTQIFVHHSLNSGVEECPNCKRYCQDLSRLSTLLTNKLDDLHSSCTTLTQTHNFPSQQPIEQQLKKVLHDYQILKKRIEFFYQQNEQLNTENEKIVQQNRKLKKQLSQMKALMMEQQNNMNTDTDLLSMQSTKILDVNTQNTIGQSSQFKKSGGFLNLESEGWKKNGENGENYREYLIQRQQIQNQRNSEIKRLKTILSVF